jgi:hypothetical protein
MVVGREQYIEAGVLDSIEEFIGGAERGVSPVRLSAQRYLQIADSDIGLADFFLDVLEAVRIVVSFLGLGGFYLRVVLHQVTNK